MEKSLQTDMWKQSHQRKLSQEAKQTRVSMAWDGMASRGKKGETSWRKNPWVLVDEMFVK